MNSWHSWLSTAPGRPSGTVHATVPDVTPQMTAAVDWLSSNGLVLAIASIGLFIVYRIARPAIHRVLVGMMRAQAATLDGDPAMREQTDKRVATIEDVLARLLRIGVIAALLVVILGVFDLWPLLAGLGFVIAAITLAGQSIVLDYLMGLLILIEGQYFKGDIIRIDDIEGTVTEVGFRRTVLVDAHGTVHSISNGLIRRAANLTRNVAIAMVDIEGIADGDVERAIEVLVATGQQLADDPAFAGRVLEPPTYVGTTRLTAAGATLRLGGRVRPEYRAPIEAELRRRTAAALSVAGVEPIRPSGARDRPGG